MLYYRSVMSILVVRNDDKKTRTNKSVVHVRLRHNIKYEIVFRLHIYVKENLHITRICHGLVLHIQLYMLKYLQGQV